MRLTVNILGHEVLHVDTTVPDPHQTQEREPFGFSHVNAAVERRGEADFEAKPINTRRRNA